MQANTHYPLDNMEIWKRIEGFDYEVSNFGRVKSLRREVWNGHKLHILSERILSPRGKRYKFVTLCGKDRNYKKEYIHRLVAIAFLDNVKEEVNHKDGNKFNNHIDNLEWNTRKENVVHAFNTGLNKGYDKSGTNNPNYKHGQRCK